jgi:hypothetical protein
VAEVTREIVEPTLDEFGADTHPAWIVVGAYRTSVSPPGAVLFDSDIRHQHVITVKVSRAARRRDLNRDWINPTREILEFTFSEAQWASFVSSMNSSGGVPATLGWHDGEIPGMAYDPRLAHTMDEVRDAAKKAQAEIKEAFDAYKEHKTADNLRTLQARIDNLPANLRFAAESLTEHSENVVQRAKADIEAFAVDKARQLGIQSADVTPELLP